MDLSFKGRAKRLDDIDLPKLGARLGVGEDELHAFIDVETRGTGFDPQGRPRILFERHIFHKYVPASKKHKAINAGLASLTPGGYGKESEQYDKLKQAIAIDRKAALFSCSWGLGQVMGFNHTLAGYNDVEQMIAAFMDDEEAHLEAAVTFIQRTGLADELRRHDWAAFAKGYNGPKYRINRYDAKLAEAFAKWKRIKDTPWKATSEPVQRVEPSPPPKPPAAPPAPSGEPQDGTKPNVVLVDGPKADETTVVVVQTPDNPPATNPVAKGKTGLMVLGTFILGLIAWAYNYFVGG